MLDWIVETGHPGCDVMNAVVDKAERADTPNLNEWLHHAKAAVSRLEDSVHACDRARYVTVDRHAADRFVQ